jgi:ribulose-5-phosphate 4-epimerase/fuculose-1-phosphate aldolase
MRSLFCIALLVSCSAGAQTPAEVPASVLENLATAHRILAAEGVLDYLGHVSVRHPSNPNRYLMPRQVAPALVTAADIVEFDLDSHAIDARGRALFSERYIHGEIYKARRDVNAVVHSHSPTVVPFSISQVPLRAVHQAGAFLGAGAPVFDTRGLDSRSASLLVRNPALGKALAATLGEKPVALMRGHGDVVVGADLVVAVARAIGTEVNARMQLNAIQLGTPVTYFTPEEAAAMENPAAYARGWELWESRVRPK